jgi:hypothetical protein
VANRTSSSFIAAVVRCSPAPSSRSRSRIRDSRKFSIHLRFFARSYVSIASSPEIAKSASSSEGRSSHDDEDDAGDLGAFVGLRLRGGRDGMRCSISYLRHQLLVIGGRKVGEIYMAVCHLVSGPRGQPLRQAGFGPFHVPLPVGLLTPVLIEKHRLDL